MTRSIIGPNTAIRYLKAYNAHVDYWREVNPAYLLAYVDKKDHTGYILEYAAAFPDSMVVARIQHPIDGGFHLPPEDKTVGHYVASPQNYHNDFGFLGRIPNVILNILNEPDGKADDATIARLVDWMREYIPIAVQSSTKSVLFNWGKGQPRLFGGMMDARFGDVLKLASLYPELFFVGLHFYGPEDTTEIIRAYLALCNTLKIKPLRVIGTEWGNDARVGGGVEAAWEISQIHHDLSEFIKSGLLVGLCRFQDGNSGGWEGYAIENDKAYKDEIKRAALAGELEPVTTKPPQPVPTPPSLPGYTPSAFEANAKYTLVIAGAYRNLRDKPGTSTGAFIGQVHNGAEVIALEQRIFEGDYWRKIRVGDKEGWVSLAGGSVEFRKLVNASEPPPVIVLPPPKPVNIYARLYDAQLKVAQAHFDLAQVYKELSQLDNAA